MTRPLAAVTSTIPLIFKRHLSPFVTNFRRARRTLCKLKTSKRRTPDFITVRFSSRRVIESRLKWNCKCEGPRSFRTIPLGRLSCPRVKVKELSQLGQFKTICLVQPSRWNVTLGGTRPRGSPGGARTTRFCPLVDQSTEGIFSRSSRSRRRTGALTIAWPKTESDAGPKVNFFFDEDSSTKIPGLCILRKACFYRKYRRGGGVCPRCERPKASLGPSTAVRHGSRVSRGGVPTPGFDLGQGRSRLIQQPALQYFAFRNRRRVHGYDFAGDHH
jgi:hypothetical protein